MQRIAMLLTVLVLTLAPTSAFAQTLCRCAQVSLEGRICQNDLTAQLYVWGGYTDARTGNRVYRASVQKVFRGQPAGNVISVEVPRDCGIDLRSYTSYGVSINKGVNANYSTFACSSWVKPWREVTRAELATLRNPSCAPTACYDYTDRDFGLCKMLLGYAVQDGVCRPIGGCSSQGLPFYPSQEACMASCAVAQDGVCYRFSETDPDAFVNRPCEDGLKCTSTSNRIGFNSERVCKPQSYCIDESSAASDCASLPHIAVPGRWGCNANSCVWRVGPNI